MRILKRKWFVSLAVIVGLCAVLFTMGFSDGDRDGGGRHPGIYVVNSAFVGMGLYNTHPTGMGIGARTDGDGAALYGNNTNATGTGHALWCEGTSQFDGVGYIGTGFRFQAESHGGARILGEQGDTPATPAIGFYSHNGVDDGGGGNGIYRPLANTMAFATGSQERMRITPGGGVGIGTIPSTILHVDGPVATAVNTVTGGSSTTPYEITSADSVILVNNSNTTTEGWVVLPYASTCPGRKYIIKKVSASTTGGVSVRSAGIDMIDGNNHRALNTMWAHIVVVSDGLLWNIVGGNGYS